MYIGSIETSPIQLETPGSNVYSFIKAQCQAKTELTMVHVSERHISPHAYTSLPARSNVVSPREET